MVADFPAVGGRLARWLLQQLAGHRDVPDPSFCGVARRVHIALECLLSLMPHLAANRIGGAHSDQTDIIRAIDEVPRHPGSSSGRVAASRRRHRPVRIVVWRRRSHAGECERPATGDVRTDYVRAGDLRADDDRS